MSSVEYRKSLLVEVDGRMVATHLPPERHGRISTYKWWRCRCEPCTVDNNLRSRPQLKVPGRERVSVVEERRRKASPARLDEQARYLLGEYEHMRGFGMSHERACARLGVHVSTVERVLHQAVTA